MILSIIVPLYNEEGFVLETINKLLKVNYPNFIDFCEIIVVDDGSTDKSYEIVLNFIRDKTNLFLLRNEKNLGKGASVRNGISIARGDVFLVQDADLELSPNDIPKMLEAMKSLNIEFINGSRYASGLTRPLSSYRRYLANKFFTFLTSVLIDVKLTDMACGYKLIHKNLYNRLNLKENRFGFEAELILKALRIKKNNIAEVPVQYFPRSEREMKKLKNSDAFRILWAIFKYGFLKLN